MSSTDINRFLPDDEYQAAINAISPSATSPFATLVASLTQGSVLFPNATGQITEDNTNFFWDDINNRLGIGINAPLGTLDVEAGPNRTGVSPTTPSFYVTGLLDTGNTGPAANNIEFRHQNQTQGIGFGFNTIYATGSSVSQSLNLLSRGSGDILLNAHPYSTGNVGIGTPSPSNLFDVEGTGGSFEIEPTGRAIDFTSGTINWIKASGAGGELHFQTGGANTQMKILPDGKIDAEKDHQAFTATINGSGGFQTVNFPTAFPGGSTVIVVGNMVSGNTDTAIIIQNGSTTNSSFAFRARNIAGSHTVHTGGETVNFMAFRQS